MMLRPFLSYYGSKWATARRYPPPRHETIIEPFAGAAGYSLRYPDRQITLVDRNPQVAAVWSYLIGTTAAQIRALPLLEAGQSTRDLAVCDEARWLIGWWVNKGVAAPRLALSAWATEPRYARQFWGPAIRERIASQVDAIRHWRVICGDYTQAPEQTGLATWFIDPPYQGPAGDQYPYAWVNRHELASWCRTRPGQVIVCELEGADWLPFEPMAGGWSNVARRDRARAQTREAVWLN